MIFGLVLEPRGIFKGKPGSRFLTISIVFYSLYLLCFMAADKIHSKMGEGTFGQVLECWDRERKEMVAIKIVRGIKKYREAAMIEIEVLQQLGKHDKGGNR